VKDVERGPVRKAGTLFVVSFAIIAVLALLLFVTFRMEFAAAGFSTIRIGLIILLNILLFALAAQVLQRISAKKKNAVFMALTLMVFLSVLEVAFMFIPRSHGFGYTYGAQNWMHYYWNPINEYGFRDKSLYDIKYSSDNVSTSDLNTDVVSDGINTTERDIVFFVGDSFTAGHGIKYVGQRYSNLVSDALPSMRGVNLGKNGLDTRGAYKTMTDFISETGITPKTIVFQYFGNDIDVVGRDHGIQFEGLLPYETLGIPAKLFVRGSFLVNYFYWLFPNVNTEEYIRQLTEMYRNEQIMAEHTSDLQKFVDFADEHESELIVVIFPFLSDLNLSREIFTLRIGDYFENQGIRVIQVTDLVEEIEPRKRIVNSNDGHASVVVQEFVAKEIISDLKHELENRTAKAHCE
jgi:hypothetical protein